MNYSLPRMCKLLLLRNGYHSSALPLDRNENESGLIGSLERWDGSAGQQLRAPAKPSRCSAKDAIMKDILLGNAVYRKGLGEDIF